MTLPKILFASTLLAFAGCATKSLPPGTPPPEYEKRPVEPWPPASDAGADATMAAVPPAGPAPTETVPPSEIPIDAGSPDAP